MYESTCQHKRLLAKLTLTKGSVPILAEKESSMWKEFWVGKNKNSSDSLAITTDSLLWLFPVGFDESIECLGCSCKLVLQHLRSTIIGS